MSNTTAAQWAFIFEQFGKERLRQMLFKAAMRKDEERRVVLEFDGKKCLDVTDHLKTLEENNE